jgi:predicted secreted protein
MAASGTPINSTSVLVQITEDSGTSYDTIAFATSASISWSMDPRDISTKSSAGNRAIAEGKKSWNVSFEGLVTYATVSDLDMPNDIFTLADARTSVGLRFGKLNSGDYVYTGSGYFTSYSQDAGVEDNNTFSVSFEGTGQLSQSSYAGV